ncbi:hypothetical protein [Bradyrhizobium sp. Leo121]|uniref:hypothetical protein n=1 Tax=Bradyrhizobium sp. Leo121 TaxID=1571195 RepID=UPI00102A71CE|nr:hypothetical protein [Bradyrhizobium sp. Leo121]RZN24784.1 hypothetical protein CWO90_28510 [Bradyrhizobium sp. Leo121]
MTHPAILRQETAQVYRALRLRPLTVNSIVLMTRLHEIKVMRALVRLLEDESITSIHGLYIASREEPAWQVH